MLISILEILPCTVDRPHPCNSFFAGLDTSGICKATTPLHHNRTETIFLYADGMY